MSARTKALIGAFAWLAFSLPGTPNVHHGIWAQVLVQLAALVIAPLLFEVMAASSRRASASESESAQKRKAGATTMLSWAVRWQVPAALVLVVAFRQEAGWIAALWAAPWAGVLGMVALAGVQRVMNGGGRSAARWCGEAGMIFAAVGAVWLMADRLGVRPLDFHPDIVLLTAVHFHYAGLILPVLAGEALGRWQRPRAARVIALAVIAGVPAVAVGITLSQLGIARGFEAGAALVMAGSGLAVAWVHVALGLKPRASLAVRCLWIAAGCSLAAGMVLAALYGVRDFFTPWPWLDIPWMRALHGSVNAIGFALLGTIAWWRVAEKERE